MIGGLWHLKYDHELDVLEVKLQRFISYQINRIVINGKNAIINHINYQSIINHSYQWMMRIE